MKDMFRDRQYYKFSAYGFLKNLRFFEVFIILFFLETGLTYLQIGLVYTIRELTRNLFEIPAGVLADSLGRRRTMIASFSLYLISFFLYYFSKGMPLIVAATIVFAFADANRTGTHKAMIFDYLEIRGWAGQKIHYYGHTRSWSQAGSAISSLAAAVLVFFTGQYSIVFLYTAIPYFLGLLLMITYPSCLDGDQSAMKQSSLRQRTVNIIRETWSSLRKRSVFWGIINVSSYSGYYRALKDYIQPVISSFALSIPVMTALAGEQRSAVMIGLVYFFIYLLSSLATRRSGPISERFGSLELMLNVSLIAGLLLGLLAGISLLVGIRWLALIFFATIFLVENLRMPAGVAWLSENLDKNILATALSTESQSKTLFTAVLAFATGFIADRWGVGAALAGCSLLLLLPLPLILIRKK